MLSEFGIGLKPLVMDNEQKNGLERLRLWGLIGVDEAIYVNQNDQM